MIKREKFEDKIFYYKKLSCEMRDVVEKVKKNEYIVERVLQAKETRNVKLILVDGEKYVLKSQKGRGIVDLILGSKALTTMKNVAKLKESNFNNIYDVEIIAEKRGILGVKETYILVPFIEGKEPKTVEEYEEVMKILKKLHSLGHYHGDSKPKNFICTKDGVVLIDTKLTKSRGNLLKWKDIARLQKRTTEHLDLKKYFGEYKKTIGYYLGVAWVYKKELLRGIKIYEEVF